MANLSLKQKPPKTVTFLTKESVQFVRFSKDFFKLFIFYFFEHVSFFINYQCIFIQFVTKGNKTKFQFTNLKKLCRNIFDEKKYFLYLEYFVNSSKKLKVLLFEEFSQSQLSF